MGCCSPSGQNDDSNDNEQGLATTISSSSNTQAVSPNHAHSRSVDSNEEQYDKRKEMNQRIKTFKDEIDALVDDNKLPPRGILIKWKAYRYRKDIVDGSHIQTPHERVIFEYCSPHEDDEKKAEEWVDREYEHGICGFSVELCNPKEEHEEKKENQSSSQSSKFNKKNWIITVQKRDVKNDNTIQDWEPCSEEKEFIFFKIIQLRENVIKIMKSSKNTYNFVTNNCQTFANDLSKAMDETARHNLTTAEQAAKKTGKAMAGGAALTSSGFVLKAMADSGGIPG